jgi:geranylgeranyl pyrophosphate synthase
MAEAMTTRFDLERFFEEGRARVDAALDDVLPGPEEGRDDPGRLCEAMRYAVLQGGKRMRPMVVMAACRAAGGSMEAALPACCAIEVVHAYSLVHDDLPAMDDDIERRGRPTVHVAFGHANAILAGDALLTIAFEILARGAIGNPHARMIEAVHRLARHAGVEGMVGGQALDLEFGQDIGELEVLERVHAWKTGGLYAASGAMGALCAGADDGCVDELERYGLAFGVAFQHADDMLDDDQLALRSQALARVDALVEQCLAIADGHGAGGAALAEIARWVKERAHAAARGEKRE